MHTAVCLCVPFCSGREFGISQHRLGNAAETAAVFFKTMITSCPASATSPNSTFSHSVRGLCRCIHVFMCVCAHLCSFSANEEKHTLCCLLINVQGFPSFTCDYGKSHSLLHQRRNTETPSELYSIRVIRRKTGNLPTRANLL